MLKGKTAVITGAARGIGAQMARKFASLGANIAIVDYGNADEIKAELESTYSVNVAVFQCDVTNTDMCKSVCKEITDTLGKVDILVNNAGITRDNLIAMMEETEFDAVIGTNLKGTFNMIKALSRNFIRNKGGSIINISSVSGIMGLPGQANYSASKAGVIGLTKSLAKELGGKNIRVNAIAPGFIKTDMTKDLGSEDEFIKAIPLKRLGETEDVANLAAFLASDNSAYITGEVIRVDGGLAM